MPISSMTGFARASGERQGLFWQWEIKSVNGKALDVRLRLPQGFEALETPVRAALAQAFRRGNLQVSLSVSGEIARETVRLNQDVLERLLAPDLGRLLLQHLGLVFGSVLLAVALGVFACNPHAVDTRHKVKPTFVYLYMLLVQICIQL